MNEHQKKGGGVNALAAVNMALDLLEEIADSSYIPFTSPAPSTSEMEVRDRIRSAIRHLQYTAHRMEVLHGGVPAKREQGFCRDCRFYRQCSSTCVLTGNYVNEMSSCPGLKRLRPAPYVGKEEVELR